jgi:hypothetical protein
MNNFPCLQQGTEDPWALSHATGSVVRDFLTRQADGSERKGVHMPISGPASPTFSKLSTDNRDLIPLCANSSNLVEGSLLHTRDVKSSKLRSRDIPSPDQITHL